MVKYKMGFPNVKLILNQVRTYMITTNALKKMKPLEEVGGELLNTIF